MKLTFTKKELLNIPNILCYIRLLCVPAFALAFFLIDRSGSSISAYSFMYISLAIFAFASITDIFDGKIARRFHMESAVGAALDPLADKLLQLMAVICLTVNGNVFWLFPVLIGVRELYQIFASIMLVSKNIVGKANYWGKAAALVVAIGIILSTFGASYSPTFSSITNYGVFSEWLANTMVSDYASAFGISIYWTSFGFLVVGTVLGWIAAGNYTYMVLSQIGGLKKLKGAENVRIDYFHNTSEQAESREEIAAREAAEAAGESTADNAPAESEEEAAPQEDAAQD